LTRGGPGSEPCTNWYKVDVIADVAKKSGVGRTTVARAKKVFDKGTTELKDKMLAGDKSIHAAYQEVKEAEQEESATSFDVDSFDVVPTPSANAAAKKSLDTKVEEMDALIEKTKALYKKLFSALDNANTQKGVENFRFLESTLRRFDVSMKACDSVFSEFSSTWKRQRKG
jgi:transposase